MTVYSEEDTLNNKKVNSKIKELYYDLKERISHWDDFNVNPKKNYISFTRNKKAFVFLNFRKNFIRVHMLSYAKTKWDGSREKVPSKSKFILVDPEKMFKISENEYKVLYEFDLKEDKNLEYFALMLKQKFDYVG